MPRLKKAFDARRAALPALSGVKGDAYRRVLDTLSLKRRKPALSLSAAARESGTTLRTIRRHAPSVLETRSGRLDVQASDRLPRPMRMLTPTGEVIVNTRSSRTASRISRHNNAVRELYTSAGDTSALKPFNDKTIRGGGKTYEFATDPQLLNRLARAGAVHFLDIYAPEAKG